MKRSCGILFPVFSLPSRFGIGSFSKEAYDFIDFLKRSGQEYWQILPLGPTGYGDSPYQTASAFAGNPYFISPEKLIEDGLLTWEECNSRNFGNDEERVDYGALYENRSVLLRIACKRAKEKGLLIADESHTTSRSLRSAVSDEPAEEGKISELTFGDFLKASEYWLEDYCLYMALKDAHNGAGWMDWETEYRIRDKKALEEFAKQHEEELEFYRFVQYEFALQWDRLHRYAAKQRIKIIGDIPFYAALDSADAWAYNDSFLMDEDHVPTAVAGCPPDAFSATGQKWGNPIYDWESLRKKDYEWWIRRIKHSLSLFDVLRIDHFHGFCDYYAIPYEAEDATEGEMHEGPRMDFFDVLKAQVGEFAGDQWKIIAEDLGTVTEENTKLLEDTGIPGMMILQYAFTSWDSVYMPHKHHRNSVVYTGNHDNATARTWIEEIGEGDRNFVRKYIRSTNSDYGAFVWDFIREAYHSVCDLSIIPLQDYLVKGKEARINVPGSQGENWQWRLKPNFLSEDLARSIRELAEIYGRCSG